MGFIGNLFSGNSGMGWRASGTDIATPTTAQQAQTAYGQTQQGLQQQQAFLQALQAQGGLANQSNVFGQQQNLANLMQGVATGTGPNPALAQLQNTTGQNIAATSAALAGARGAGANPALAARSAARLGAETQQQAAGQGAVLAAQQQIAGMDALSRQQQQMAQLAGSQVGQQAAATNAYSTAAQNQQQNILAAINAQNQANVAMQSNINNANAGIQGITAQGQQGLLGGLIGGAGAALQLPIGATGGKVKPSQIGNNPRAYYAEGGEADAGDVKRTNAPRIDEPSSYKIDTGVPSGTGAASIEKGMTRLGSAIGARARAGSSSPMPSIPPAKLDMPEAGSSMRQAQDFTGGSAVKPFTAGSPGTLQSSPGFGSYDELSRMTQENIDRQEYPELYRPVPSSSFRTPVLGAQLAKGGKVPALVSPGEKYLTPEQAQDVLKGKENPLNGKTIPGKAKVKGDSYKNDTVPVTLEEGGCVIPRSVLQSDQPMKNAIKFVHAHMKKMAKGGKVENEKKQEQMVPVSRDMAQAVLQQPHFLFTSENPHVTPALKMSYEATLDALKKMGFVAEPAQGKYGAEEPSIMVHNVSPEQVPNLKRFAKALGQESAIYSVGGKHEAHYLNGKNEGKVARGEGTEIHDKEPENFYTKTKNGLIFSHQIDWDNLYDN
jgi:hypothetical protein